jgi:hypothetical protein
MRRPTMVLMGLLAMASLAHAQVDGRNIPSKYGAPLASQTNYTGFGDRVSLDQTSGSELNQLFIKCVNGVLYLAVTGNLEGRPFSNSIHFYIDTGRNPNNTFTLTTGCINCSVQGMSGVVFDHKPDYVLSVSHFDDGQGNDNIYIDLHDVVNNQSTYLGAVAVGAGEGTVDQGVKAGFDNSNLQGVTSDPNNIGNPATATTGLEVAIPLSALGNPQGEIKILALLTGGADLGNECHGTYLSNQSLPAMNIGNPSQQFPNPAWARCPSPPFDPPDFFPFSFVALEGTHYVSVQPCPAGPEGDVNGDGCVDDADLLIVLFNFGNAGGQGDVNNDNIVDDADLLIVLFNFGAGC